MSALDAFAKLQESRKPKPAEAKLSDSDRGNLQIWLTGRMASGWTAADRKEYLDACAAEFTNPVAGGIAAACEFWRLKTS